MDKQQRQRAILERAARAGGVAVAALAREFGASEMTLRRDLAELHRLGKLDRTHGGAVPSRTAAVEFLFSAQAALHRERKQAIARVAAARIAPGMRISLDTGTTTLELARAVAGIERLTVLTTSLAIAAALHARANIELVLLGGSVRKLSPDLSGPLTVENTRRFRVDMTFLGMDAVTPAGLFTTDLQTAELNTALAEQADRVVLLADSSKFERQAFVRSLPLSRLDWLVTDAACSQKTRRWLRRLVKEVSYAAL
ncbi:MAG: DeoR/GlpR family DNA-binding transcription regulator [Kiritimatiellae bacterium]|nr:DeoR/GlpR family DNA-binding transcription regulator [Kiritimatiellia bacterium]